MGELVNFFSQDTAKQAKPEQLELLIIPEREEGQENYLEESYRFCLKDKQTIVVGRLDDSNLEEELKRKDKVFIPSLRFIPSLAAMLSNPQATVLFDNIKKECRQIRHERHYHRISREHLGITRDVNGYVLKNLTEGTNGSRVSNPSPSIIVYDPSTRSSAEVHSEGLVLRDGAVIRLGYLPNPMTEYPVSFSVSIKKIKDPMEETRRVREAFPFQH